MADSGADSRAHTWHWPSSSGRCNRHRPTSSWHPPVAAHCHCWLNCTHYQPFSCEIFGSEVFGFQAIKIFWIFWCWKSEFVANLLKENKLRIVLLVLLLKWDKRFLPEFICGFSFLMSFRCFDNSVWGNIDFFHVFCIKMSLKCKKKSNDIMINEQWRIYLIRIDLTIFYFAH